MTHFKELDLNEQIQTNLSTMGYENPTEIQAAALPPIIAKKDVVIHSHTGSGKTAAFLIPFIQNVRLDIPAVQYIILVPTRELAAQVTSEAERISKGTGVKIASIYGGIGFKGQIKSIKDGAQLIVGTPGRILDHLKRRNLSLSVARGLVLDEGDKMLSMGFLPEVRLIMDYLPKRHQTILSSATFPPAIELIIEQYMMEPTRLSMSTGEQTAKEISHYYCLVGMDEKEKTLLAFLEKEDPSLSLIFCNTKADVSSVFQFLKHAGLNVAALSSELPQKKRESILHALRVGKINHLVCTDLASRGIDIPHLSHVFLHSAGEDLEAYVHRTGRTGRAGRAGKAISIVSGQDIANFNMALKVHEIEANEISAPSEEEVAQSRSSNYLKQLEDIGFAKDTDVHDEFTKMAESINSEQVQSLLPFLLERFFKAPKLPEWDRQETHLHVEPSAPSESEPSRNSKTRPPKQFRGKTMCLALGQKDGMDEFTLRNLLKKQANVRNHQIGRIEIFEYETFFEIHNAALRGLRKMQGKHYRHFEIKLDASPVPFDKVDQFRELKPVSA